MEKLGGPVVINQKLTPLIQAVLIKFHFNKVKGLRITNSCGTIIDRKTLGLTKKDTPHPKTKEKPQ